MIRSQWARPFCLQPLPKQSPPVLPGLVGKVGDTAVPARDPRHRIHPPNIGRQLTLDEAFFFSLSAPATQDSREDAERLGLPKKPPLLPSINRRKLGVRLSGGCGLS